MGAEELLGWSPLLEVGPLTATARTLVPTRLLVLNAAQVKALCDGDPGFGYEFIRRVAQVLAQRLEATRRHLQLTPEERELLARLLKTEFRETRAEVHHTRSASFRQGVKQEETLLRGLLHKLQITLG